MAEPALPTVENVFGVLRAGIDPELGTGIVEWGWRVPYMWTPTARST